MPESVVDSAPERVSERDEPSYRVRLGLELVVVFISVYAAFALSQYQAKRDAAERRRQIQEALVREITDLTSNTRRVAKQLPVQLAQFDSGFRTGADLRCTPGPNQFASKRICGMRHCNPAPWTCSTSRPCTGYHSFITS